MELLKTCTRCKAEKPRDAEHFPLHNKCKDGLDSWCRECRRSYRNGNRRGLYRHMISDEDLRKEFQNFKGCEICGKMTDKICVDHDHETETYRGLLCDSCNMGLGKFYDDIETLQKAIEYLRRKK